MNEKTFPNRMPRENPRAAIDYCLKSFTEHPATADETYFQHLCFTWKMASRFLRVGLALMVHGLLPFMFTRHASKNVARIYDQFQERLQRCHKKDDCV